MSETVIQTKSVRVVNLNRNEQSEVLNLQEIAPADWNEETQGRFRSNINVPLVLDVEDPAFGTFDVNSELELQIVKPS